MGIALLLCTQIKIYRCIKPDIMAGEMITNKNREHLKSTFDKAKVSLRLLYICYSFLYANFCQKLRRRNQTAASIICKILEV
jgi:hypothetical protein